MANCITLFANTSVLSVVPENTFPSVAWLKRLFSISKSDKGIAGFVVLLLLDKSVFA